MAIVGEWWGDAPSQQAKSHPEDCPLWAVGICGLETSFMGVCSLEASILGDCGLKAPFFGLTSLLLGKAIWVSQGLISASFALARWTGHGSTSCLQSWRASCEQELIRSSGACSNPNMAARLLRGCFLSTYPRRSMSRSNLPASSENG
mmetsp:Transcript_73210/g.118087  ORF Transcript_73210/g.118087 Transcript_73210/m.118087 type:complete len:148 (+) Transcript_73210:391-834(+)